MPDYRIEFQELGDCVEFVDSVLRNHAKLRIPPEEIGVDVRVSDDDAKVFAIVITDLASSVGEELRRLARCPGFETASSGAGGDRITLNQLLERVKMVRQPQMVPGRPLAILLFGARDDEFRQRYTELMDMGCRGFRVGIVKASTKNQNVTHVILVEKPPRGFWPAAEWNPQSDVQFRTVACYRWRSAEDCRLYVEWSYEHPVERIEQLYDFDHPACHGVFALNGSDGTEGLGGQWLHLRHEDYDGVFSLGEQKLKLDLTEPLATVELQGVSHHDELSLDFRVQREARGTSSSLDAVETQIAHHQQAIVDLQRDYRAAHALRRQAIFLAYVFEQDLQGAASEPPPISTTFARFLQQPYGQLEHMTYGFYQDPGEHGHGLHLVFDERPETHSQLLISLADEVYVQRADWQEWGLPLFVRRGDDVRPRLEDQNFAPLVKELLWESKSHPLGEPILLRTLAADAVKSHGTQWEALYVRNLVPLRESSCLKTLNRRFSCKPLEFCEGIPSQLERNLEDTNASLSSRCKQLESHVLEAVEERVQVAERKWTHTDEQIQRLLRDTNQHTQAVDQAQAAISSFPREWTDFVENVLTAHRNLHARKIDAAAAYRQAQEGLTQLLEAHEAAILDVKWQVSQDIDSVERHRATYQTIEQQAQSFMDDLSRKVATFRRVQAEIRTEVSRIKHSADGQINDIKEELDETRARKAEVENNLRVIERLRGELRQEQQLVDENSRRTEKAQREREKESADLKKQRNDLRNEEDQLAQLSRDVEKLKSEYLRDNPIVQRKRVELENQKREIDIQIAQLKADQQASQRKQNELKGQELEIEQKRANLSSIRAGIENSMLSIQGIEADRQAEQDQIKRLMQQLQQRRLDLGKERLKLEEERERQAKDVKFLETEEHQLEQEKLQLATESKQRVELLDDQIRTINNQRAALQRLMVSVQFLSKAVDDAFETDQSSASSQPFNVEVCGTKAPELLEEIRKRLS